MKKLLSFFTIILFLIPLSVYGGMGIGGHGPTYGGDPAKPGTVSELKQDHTVETLNADRTILITDKPILWFDCNGSDRNVTLPAMASNSTDLVFTIVNRSDGSGEDLVVRDGNATPVTLFTIGPKQGQRFSCDGTDWETWFDSGTYYDGIGKGTQIYRILAQTVTDANITLTSAHFGKSIHMSSASDHVAFLPSVGSSDSGARIRICKTGAGKVTTDAADSDLINDSGAGDTIYNDVAAETYAFVDLEYVHAIVTWIATGTGTWVTTD